MALLALLAAAVAGTLAWRDVRRMADPEPPKPRWLRVEALVTPQGARATLAPLGATIGPNGRLTILGAPGSAGRPAPLVHGTIHWGDLAAPFDKVPNAMLAGVRALFRALPPPSHERDEELLIVGSPDWFEGRLLLVDGCFRFGGADGPHAIFPFGTRLGLRDGYLVVGPPGLPPARSARVGETIVWETYFAEAFGPGVRAAVRRRCGPGKLLLVLPESRSVKAERSLGFAASDLAREEGGTWEEALARLRACQRAGGDHPSCPRPSSPPRPPVPMPH